MSIEEDGGSKMNDGRSTHTEPERSDDWETYETQVREFFSKTNLRSEDRLQENTVSRTRPEGVPRDLLKIYRLFVGSVQVSRDWHQHCSVLRLCDWIRFLESLLRRQHHLWDFEVVYLRNIGPPWKRPDRSVDLTSKTDSSYCWKLWNFVISLFYFEDY